MPDYTKPKMTNWYDPRQLIDTAKRTVISTTFGQYADPSSGMPDPTHYKFFDQISSRSPFKDFSLRGEYLNIPIPPTYSTRYNLIWFLSVLVVSGIGGYLVGSFIMGVYLYVSLHVFGRHSNEAFSALKIEDYKNFLRMHSDKSGGLTIYPIKIETVPRDWADKGEYFKPSGGTAPELIEAPIVVR